MKSFLVSLESWENNPAVIEVNMDVPLGDLPFALSVEDINDGKTIKFEYSNPEHNVSKVRDLEIEHKDNMFYVVFGKNSGRIYEIHLSSEIQKKGLLNKIAIVGKKKIGESNIRKSKNFEFGRSLCEKALSKA